MATHPLRIGEAAALLGVSTDTVRRLVDRGAIAGERTGGGSRSVDGADLARYLEDQAAADVDASLSTRSARNRFTGLVTSVTIDGLVAQVELRAGPFRVVSLLTSEAARELGLEPGMVATASVKATSVVIEVPSPR